MASRETPCCGGDGSGPFRSDFPEGDPDSGRMEVGSLLDAFDLRHALRGTHQADPGRIPPDQKATDQFPVLHAGPVPEIDLRARRDGAPAFKDGVKGKREAYFSEARGFVPCTVYDRYSLFPGMEFSGPAIVEERESTTIVGPSATARIDDYLNLIIEIGE